MIKTFVLHQEAQTNILKVTCVTLQQKSDLENNIVWRSSLYRGLGNITKYKNKPNPSISTGDTFVPIALHWRPT